MNFLNLYRNYLYNLNTIKSINAQRNGAKGPHSFIMFSVLFFTAHLYHVCINIGYYLFVGLYENKTVRQSAT